MGDVQTETREARVRAWSEAIALLQVVVAQACFAVLEVSAFLLVMWLQARKFLLAGARLEAGTLRLRGRFLVV